jgi:tetratricopeptide (TPR) repeat protein
VLGGLLALWSAWSYVRGASVAGPGPLPSRWLLTTVALYVAAVLAKESSLPLPGALVVLDVYPLRRLGGGPGRWFGPAVRPVWREKLLLGAVALALAPLAARGRLSAGAEAPPWDPALALVVAGHASVFYVWQTFGAGTLAPVYELPFRARPADGPLLAGALAALALTGLLIWRRHRWPAALAAWVSYLVLLAPVSGVAPFGRLHLAADRYTYLACAGWALAGGLATATWWLDLRRPLARALALGALLLVLGGWGARTWHQTGVWRDGITLWTYAALATPDSAVAQNNLGAELERAGDLAGAAARYERAARLWPTYAPFHARWGRALAEQGRLAEALGPFQRAVALAPREAAGLVGLGVVLFRLGRVEEAVRRYEDALRLESSAPLTHLNLALAHERLGRRPDALAHFRRALELDATLREAADGLRRLSGG